jgi:hypothetical protein
MWAFTDIEVGGERGAFAPFYSPRPEKKEQCYIQRRNASRKYHDKTISNQNTYFAINTEAWT